MSSFRPPPFRPPFSAPVGAVGRLTVRPAVGAGRSGRPAATVPGRDRRPGRPAAGRESPRSEPGRADHRPGVRSCPAPAIRKRDERYSRLLSSSRYCASAFGRPPATQLDRSEPARTSAGIAGARGGPRPQVSTVVRIGPSQCDAGRPNRWGGPGSLRFGSPQLQRPIRTWTRAKVSKVRETFDRPADVRVEDYLQGSFRAVRGDGDYRVVLRNVPSSRPLITPQWRFATSR
jgi:hypothetical protein